MSIYSQIEKQQFGEIEEEPFPIISSNLSDIARSDEMLSGLFGYLTQIRKILYR